MRSDRSPWSRGDSKGIEVELCPAVNHYFTDFLPAFTGKALVPGLDGIDTRIRFTIHQPGHPVSWDVTLRSGCISTISPMEREPPDIEYQVSEETFLSVTGGSLSAERAFMLGKVKIRGSLLKGLKMAVLLQSFFERFPYRHGAGSIEIQKSREIDGQLTAFPEELGIFEKYAESENQICEELLHHIEGKSSIDLRLTYPMEGSCPWNVILVPPHPLLGATSDNELLRYLAHFLALHGCFAVRFGYSFGVNTGSASLHAVQTFWDTSDTENDLGLTDLISVWDWLEGQPIRPDEGVALIGYSYGAQLVLKSLSKITPTKEILISPVVSQLGAEIRNVTAPLLMVTADTDFAATREESMRLSESFPVRPVWIPLAGADHFYQGKKELLACAIRDFLGLIPKEPRE